jgi:DNA-directed RNA polymerase specialized sigma24 family protein
LILEKAFKKHKTWMRIVVSFGCNPVTAEDIVQEAYIKVDEMTKKGKDLSYKGDLNYWYMYKILRHLYLHLKIKEQKSKIVDQQFMKNDYGQTRSIEEVARAPSYIDYNNFNEKFEKVLSELNWYDRSVFELVSTGKKISVLSRETNINYVSLWNTYSKVKKYIQSKVENYDWFRGFDRKNN